MAVWAHLQFRFKSNSCLADGGSPPCRTHVPAGRPSAPARCVFINVLRHIRYFGHCRTRCKGTQKRIRCRFACRRLLRLPPAPAHHLAFGRTGCSKVGRQRIFWKRGSRISEFRGNKMSGCPMLETRVSYLCLCSVPMHIYRFGRLHSFGEYHMALHSVAHDGIFMAW